MVHAVPCRGQWNFLLIYLAFYCTVYIKDNKVILFLKFCLVSKLFVSHLWNQIKKKRNMWIMCGSRKYPYPPHGRPLEIPRGRGGSKAVISEGYGGFMGNYFPRGDRPCTKH